MILKGLYHSFLVDVQECDVLVSVHVPVEAVVVGDQLVLPLVVPLGDQEQVLQHLKGKNSTL